MADRFHLHNNLLDAIKEALKSILPTRIGIGKEDGDEAITQDIENTQTGLSQTAQANVGCEQIGYLLSKNEEDNLALILEVQRLHCEAGLSKTEIKDKVGISYRRIRRYLNGDAVLLCFP